MSRAIASRVAVAAAAAAVLFGTTTIARAADAKDEVRAAVQKLADAKSYTYTTAVENAGGGGGPGGGGSTGKVEKGGYTSLAVTVRDDTINVVKQGDKVAVETDDGWKLATEMQDAQGPQRMLAGLARTYKTPVEQAEQVLADAPELKKGDAAGTFTAELPEAAAKKLMTMGRGGRRGGAGGGANAPAGNGPQVANAKATVTFTLADGSLAKMAVHTSGTVSYNGNDREVDRTATTEFKDVGTTKADVPADAKAKLDAAPTTKP